MLALVVCQIKLEAAAADLGLTLQTGFVTKALVGLFGSDRFRLAVSADSSARVEMSYETVLRCDQFESV